MEEEVEFERRLLLFCAGGGIVALILAGEQSRWVTQRRQGYCYHQRQDCVGRLRAFEFVISLAMVYGHEEGREVPAHCP